MTDLSSKTATQALSEAEEASDYYVKCALQLLYRQRSPLSRFRALVEEQLQSVFVHIAQRSVRAEYNKSILTGVCILHGCCIRLLEDCQHAFCKSRAALILDLVKRRITELQDCPLDTLLRDGFAYVINVRQPLLSASLHHCLSRFVMLNISSFSISFQKRERVPRH